MEYSVAHQKSYGQDDTVEVKLNAKVDYKEYANLARELIRSDYIGGIFVNADGTQIRFFWESKKDRDSDITIVARFSLRKIEHTEVLRLGKIAQDYLEKKLKSALQIQQIMQALKHYENPTD